jgi:hypothetical protein
MIFVLKTSGKGLGDRMSEEKLLKLMAQLGLVALVIWVMCMAFSVGTPAPQPVQAARRNWGLGRPTGNIRQQGCCVAPFAQPTFQPGLQMGIV